MNKKIKIVIIWRILIIMKIGHEFPFCNKGNEHYSVAKAPSICSGTYVHMGGAPGSHQT